MRRNLLLIGILSVVLASSVGAGELDYREDVAPLLRDYCAGCHNESDYEGEFSVETFAALMEGGETKSKKSIVPGKPEESYLLQTILHEAKPVMPPKREPQLSAEEKEIISAWIEAGAKGPKPGEDVSILSTLIVPELTSTGQGATALTAQAFSNDGKWQAVATYGNVDVIEVASGQVKKSIPVGEGKVNAVHFSPDGSQIVTASGITGLKGSATIWDVATGSLVSEFGSEAHRDILFDAEFSPDGRLLATAGYDRVIRLWDVAKGKYLRKFPSHNGAVYDLAFSPDGTVLASASGDSTCKIWNVETGERLDTLNQPEGEQFRVSFTPDGKYILGAGADNRVRLWRFLSKEKPKINPVLHTRFAHEDSIVDLVISPDGTRVATASADNTVKLWSLPGLGFDAVLEAQPDLVSAMHFAMEGGKLSVLRMDGSRSLYQLPAAKKRASAPSKALAKSYGEPDLEGGTGSSMKPAAPRVVEEGPGAKLAKGIIVKGAIREKGERDRFAFEASEGETFVFEVKAARDKSLLDSRIAVLDENGEPVERVVLQAVRDSWLTFRGKDSKTSGDFRVHNWREMELNEYLFVNGEVVKLWHYPRGPDSGFLVYPGFGERHTYFGTTPLSHPLGQPCYIVRALPAGADPDPNGLPLYRIFYENDDDSSRKLGADSKLTFVAPADGNFTLEISDVAGEGGDGYHYELSARESAPGFSVSVSGKAAEVSSGTSHEFAFTAKREDGFSGPIEIGVTGLPEGMNFPESILIQDSQYRAYAALALPEDFSGLSKEEADRVKLTATARINGEAVTKPLGNLGMFEKVNEPKFAVGIHPKGNSGVIADDGVLEFVIHPGETIQATVKVDRMGFKPRIDFGKEDSGRNLPHGVYVDNIGLNGLMIPEGKEDQTFFLTAAPWVPETVREFHLRATTKPNPATQTVRLRVLARDSANLASQ